ncbi:hypothetical protein ASZ90_015961 [hydrocarbon metagenome]|uniref:Uncharacterized protein n=1 Tax=hydrocarbon metagenome TaxID=938273 RepID=A0A0W8F0K1_9ZZZZ
MDGTLELSQERSWVVFFPYQDYSLYSDPRITRVSTSRAGSRREHQRWTPGYPQ